MVQRVDCEPSVQRVRLSELEREFLALIALSEPLTLRQAEEALDLDAGDLSSPCLRLTMWGLLEEGAPVLRLTADGEALVTLRRLRERVGE